MKIVKKQTGGSLLDRIKNINNTNNTAEFLQRLRTGSKESIKDWEDDNSVANYKMASSDYKGKEIAFPMIQKINGVLHDFTDPKYGNKTRRSQFDAGYDSAIKNNDYVFMNNAEDFADNGYKNYYPGFSKYGYNKNNNYYGSSVNPIMLNNVDVYPSNYINKKLYGGILKRQNGGIVDNTDPITTPIAQQVQRNSWKPNNVTNRQVQQNQSWSPSDFIKRQINRWEGSTMATNAPMQIKAQEVSRITPNFNMLNPAQKDSLFSYYYNITPATYKNTIVPLTRMLSTAQSDDDRQRIENQIAQSINVGMNRPGMKGLRNRRLYEQKLFKEGYTSFKNGGSIKMNDYEKVLNIVKEFKKGGSIDIKEKNKGKFTATKKKTGKSTEQLMHSKNPITKKRAIFAHNAKSFKHENGGLLDFLKKGNKLKKLKKNTKIKSTGGQVSVDRTSTMMNALGGILDKFKKGGSLKEIRKKPGGSNVGKKTFANGKKRTGPYAGTKGGAPAGSYPIGDEAHAKAALRLAHNAPNPQGIKNAVYKKYPRLKKKSDK